MKFTALQFLQYTLHNIKNGGHKLSKIYETVLDI